MGNVIQMGPPSGSATGRAELLDHSRTHPIGAAPRWQRFRRWTGPWLTGQCEFCESPFTEGGAPGLISGYSVMGGGPAGQNDYCWICAICFESWRDHFCWTVLDTLGRATRVPDLLESMADLTAWPADMDAGERRRPALQIARSDEPVAVEMLLPPIRG